jgi:transmembrane sensor
MTEEPPFGLQGHLEPRWTDCRAAQVRSAVKRRARNRRLVRRAISASSLILAGGIALALFLRHELVVKQAPQATGQLALPSPALAQPMATPLTAETELVVDPEGSGRAFVLRRGLARFVVPHDEGHPFRVRVGSLVVEDVGTIFSVVRLSEKRSEISVEEGRVAVLCEGTRIDLGGGQRQVFECGQPGNEVAAARPAPVAVPRTPVVAVGSSSRGAGPALSRSRPAGVEATKAVVASTAASRAKLAPVSSEAPAWQDLAERGQYHEAYDSLRNETQVPVRDETHELLLAADTARLSGHSSEAVPYLRRILLRHRDDPRAYLVAFTLGRVLLDELGQPAEAADAFERARASRGPLAEDALAREVEAWARAGDPRRARALAVEYQRAYPQGRRIRAVANFGGLAP